ncbi:MAG TPA: helix-turn-helix domain-containing protein [Allosphingosinicella sp.]|jgi:AraC-like DNA-binding protein
MRALAPSIKFVLTGEEVYTIGRRQRRVRPGEFLLVEAGVDLEVQTSRADETVGLCVYLGASPATAGPGGPEFGPMLAGAPTDPLADLLGRYARILTSRPEAGAQLANGIVRAVASRANDFLTDFARRIDRLGNVKASTRIETLYRLERARAFIHASAERSLRLDEIATVAALSRFHLIRSFSEVYGLPPLAYHRQLRFDAAARRLKADSTSVTTLASELGYGSLSAFSRAFRQHFGVPPSRTRDMSS